MVNVQVKSYLFELKEGEPLHVFYNPGITTKHIGHFPRGISQTDLFMSELSHLLNEYKETQPELFSFNPRLSVFLGNGVAIAGSNTHYHNDEQPRGIWYELELGIILDEGNFRKLYGNLKELIENGGEYTEKDELSLFSCLLSKVNGGFRIVKPDEDMTFEVDRKDIVSHILKSAKTVYELAEVKN